MFTTSPVTMPSPRSGRAAERDDRLAGRDRRADGHVEPLAAKLLDRLQDAQGGADRALGVVLVRHRRAEDRHHRVPDELLDRASEALDVGLDALVVRAEERAHVLGIGAVRAPGEADEVDEEDGDDLSFLPRGRRGREVCAARQAEASSLRVLLAARRANLHPA